MRYAATVAPPASAAAAVPEGFLSQCYFKRYICWDVIPRSMLIWVSFHFESRYFSPRLNKVERSICGIDEIVKSSLVHLALRLKDCFRRYERIWHWLARGTKGKER